MALSKKSSTSVSGGAEQVTFEIHNGPLMPVSRRDSFCVKLRGLLTDAIFRMMAIVTSVLASCLEELADKCKVLRSAVLRINGVSGSRSFTSTFGGISIVSVWSIRQQEVYLRVQATTLIVILDNS